MPIFNKNFTIYVMHEHECQACDFMMYLLLDIKSIFLKPFLVKLKMLLSQNNCRKIWFAWKKVC